MALPQWEHVVTLASDSVDQKGEQNVKSAVSSNFEGIYRTFGECPKLRDFREKREEERQTQCMSAKKSYEEGFFFRANFPTFLLHHEG